ncbi:hypothetical protein GCM10009828_064240 [Actinoplanes couchii]
MTHSLTPLPTAAVPTTAGWFSGVVLAAAPSPTASAVPSATAAPSPTASAVPSGAATVPGGPQ